MRVARGHVPAYRLLKSSPAHVLRSFSSLDRAAQVDEPWLRKGDTPGRLAKLAVKGKSGWRFNMSKRRLARSNSNSGPASREKRKFWDSMQQEILEQTSLFDLIIALKQHDLMKVQELILSGKCTAHQPVGDPEFQETPLLFAAKYGSPGPIIEFLLDQEGVDVNQKSIYGWTALHNAAHRGHVEVIRALLRRGANVNSTNEGGWSPLHCACNNQYDSCTELLLEAGSGVNAKTDNGWTPLHCAVSRGFYATTQLLLKVQGVDVNLVNSGGWTVLHCAAIGSYYKIFHLLLENGADVSADNVTGWSVLHCAVQAKDSEMVKLLVAHGANPMRPNRSGWAPIHVAAGSGDTELVRYFVSLAEVDIDSGNSHGWTPLISAAQSNSYGVCRILLEKGAKVHLANTGKWTALHCAAHGGYRDICKLLLGYGAPTHPTTEYGYTPKKCAWAANAHDVVELIDSAERERGQTRTRSSSEMNVYISEAKKSISTFRSVFRLWDLAPEASGDQSRLSATHHRKLTQKWSVAEWFHVILGSVEGDNQQEDIRSWSFTKSYDLLSKFPDMSDEDTPKPSRSPAHPPSPDDLHGVLGHSLRMMEQAFWSRTDSVKQLVNDELCCRLTVYMDHYDVTSLDPNSKSAQSRTFIGYVFIESPWDAGMSLANQEVAEHFHFNEGGGSRTYSPWCEAASISDLLNQLEAGAKAVAATMLKEERRSRETELELQQKFMDSDIS